jgi:quaternary ammonium compound-resistance protein SugE
MAFDCRFGTDLTKVSRMGWIYLILAGLFEIGFTTSMRYMDWSMRPLPIVAFLICSALSFGLLIAAMKSVPLGTAYAVWTGIGATGTAILGILYYGEAATTWRLVFLVTLIGSIMGLKLVAGE